MQKKKEKQEKTPQCALGDEGSDGLGERNCSSITLMMMRVTHLILPQEKTQKQIRNKERLTQILNSPFPFFFLLPVFST